MVKIELLKPVEYLGSLLYFSKTLAVLVMFAGLVLPIVWSKPLNVLLNVIVQRLLSNSI